MIEILMVVALVIWSALVVFKKVFPQTSSKAFGILAERCHAQGWTRLAAWLKPTASGGCGGNCACPASQSNTTKPAEVQAVRWK